jgi:hypothetical protein
MAWGQAAAVPDVIDSPADAEAQAAVWMIGLGFADAMPTQFTADGGIDVVSSRAVAQVKFQVAPVGRPALQNLVGAAGSEHPGKFKLFFSWKGYSGPAFVFAEQAHVALFSFTTGGELVPENTQAEHLCSLAQSSMSANLVGVPLVEPAPPPPQYLPLLPPSAPPARDWIDWFTRRRLMALSAAFLVLLAVLFFATHPNALGQLLTLVVGGLLVWYGVKVTFTPKKRRRSRSRTRRRR